MALNDRFHQLRGDKFAQMANMAPGGAGMDAVRGDTARGIVDQLLASRGAPITPENQAAALEYLMGGQLEGLSMQGTTASDIASQALMESDGVSNAAPAVQSPRPEPRPGGPASSPRPQPRPGDAPATVAPQDTGQPDDGSGIPWEMLAALPAAKVATAQGNGRTNLPPKAGLTGEIVEDAPGRAVMTGSDQAMPQRMNTARAADDVTVTVNPPRTDNALPGPAESVAIDDPMADTQQLAQGAPDVGKAQRVGPRDIMMQIGNNPVVEQLDDGSLVHRGNDGMIYIVNDGYDNGIRLTADEYSAMAKQPGWKSIILNTLRGR